MISAFHWHLATLDLSIDCTARLFGVEKLYHRTLSFRRPVQPPISVSDPEFRYVPVAIAFVVRWLEIGEFEACLWLLVTRLRV